MNRFSNIFFSFTLVGVLGIFPFFQSQEPPDKFIKEFAENFSKKDAGAIYNSMHADVVDGTDLTVFSPVPSRRAWQTGRHAVFESYRDSSCSVHPRSVLQPKVQIARALLFPARTVFAEIEIDLE